MPRHHQWARMASAVLTAPPPVPECTVVEGGHDSRSQCCRGNDDFAWLVALVDEVSEVQDAIVQATSLRRVLVAQLVFGTWVVNHCADACAQIVGLLRVQNFAVRDVDSWLELAVFDHGANHVMDVGFGLRREVARGRWLLGDKLGPR